MTELFELFVLIVSKCPESFGCAIQNDISLFIHPYGKSYDDLIDLLPSRNRLLMTKVIATTRHWARCETVDIMVLMATFRYRQSHPHRSTAPSQYSTPRTRPLDIFVPQTNFPSESSNVILSTKTAPSLPTTTRIDDTSNALIGPSKPIQNHRPTTTSAASIEGPVEFIRPPMKDLYSAPIPIDPCKGRLISTEILMSNATAATSIPRLPKYVTSAIETPRIKAERKRPTPITLMPSPSNTVLSRPTTTTSVSPTTVESFITKMSSRSSEEQEEDYSPTARRGWRIWDKPFQSWKRKSFHKILLLPENPVPPLPSFTDRIENTNAVFTPGVSSPIAVPISTVPKISSDDVNTTDRSKKLPTRPGLAPRF
ncbi:hypothetical protein FBU30_007968 [Linnemannia zychae]|nr:hypothetical protein FBU30_007968 [Linnemannia zychae]